MADNVGYTAGAGTTIASDDVSGVHYQRVKINDGTADGTNALVVTSRGAAMTEGTIAHDNPVSTTNPVLIGAAAATALPTAVADSDVVRVVADKYGRQIVMPYTMPDKLQQYTSPSDITDTADDAVFSAVASTKHYITQFSAMNTHATVGTWVYLKDGSTVIYSGYCAPAGGGFVVTFPTPLVGTANTAINVANATTGAATRVNVSGFQAP